MTSMIHVNLITSANVDEFIHMPRVTLATIPNGTSVSNAIESPTNQGAERVLRVLTRIV